MLGAIKMNGANTVFELKRKFVEVEQRVGKASRELEDSVARLKQASTGSPDWQQATSAVAAAHMELVKLQGGLTPDGRTVKGELASIEEALREAEAEAALADVSRTLMDIEDSLRDRFSGELAGQLAGLGFTRVDFQVEFDSAASPLVRVVRHGGRVSGRRPVVPRVASPPARLGTTQSSAREQWNGEYYVSFGVWEGRSWDEARRYGFVSGGGGQWYSKTLRLLRPGDRIWVNVPRRGYVGVGRVTGTAVISKDFRIMIDGRERLFLDVAQAGYMREFAADEDKAEYFVPVEWIETRPLDGAITEVGFFGNQNTVCRPTTPKWDHTVARLKKRFLVE